MESIYTMIDKHGEMGFMEAIVSMMAISVVIGLYVAFVATNAVVAYDPLDDFDEDSVELKYEAGIELASESYLYSYLVKNNLRGIAIELTVPHYEKMPVVHTIGETEGVEYKQAYMVLSEYDNGRRVPVIMEVTAFV